MFELTHWFSNAETQGWSPACGGGTRKEEEITKRMALEVKVRKINESGSKTGTVALIEQEYDADLLERQIAGINDFMTAVTARKAAL